MIDDRPGGEGDHQSSPPGQFNSAPRALSVVSAWLLLTLLLAIFIGFYSHIIYELFKLGWGLVD